MTTCILGPNNAGRTSTLLIIIMVLLIYMVVVTDNTASYKMIAFLSESVHHSLDEYLNDNNANA